MPSVKFKNAKFPKLSVGELRLYGHDADPNVFAETQRNWTMEYGEDSYALNIESDIDAIMDEFRDSAAAFAKAGDDEQLVTCAQAVLYLQMFEMNKRLYNKGGAEEAAAADEVGAFLTEVTTPRVMTEDILEEEQAAFRQQQRRTAMLANKVDTIHKASARLFKKSVHYHCNA